MLCTKSTFVTLDIIIADKSTFSNSKMRYIIEHKKAPSSPIDSTDDNNEAFDSMP
ncbi:MAG: hypothetical protein ABI210_06045 [Abditibacteriaceae bacterium]